MEIKITYNFLDFQGSMFWFADLNVNCNETNVFGFSKETYDHIELAPAKKILLSKEFDAEKFIIQLYGKSFKNLGKIVWIS